MLTVTELFWNAIDGDIVTKWRQTGLLAGLTGDTETRCAIYLERALRYLSTSIIHTGETEFKISSKDGNRSVDVEKLLFPLIRRLVDKDIKMNDLLPKELVQTMRIHIEEYKIATETGDYEVDFLCSLVEKYYVV